MLWPLHKLIFQCIIRGFVWFTNYESRKAADLALNPHAALTFWWGNIEQSVRIEGVVEKISFEESDAYFAQRPRHSQLGAWASNQSRKVESREELDDLEHETNEKFKEKKEIPRPPYWGGYRLTPYRIEFWKVIHTSCFRPCCHVIPCVHLCIMCREGAEECMTELYLKEILPLRENLWLGRSFKDYSRDILSFFFAYLSTIDDIYMIYSCLFLSPDTTSRNVIIVISEQ